MFTKTTKRYNVDVVCLLCSVRLVGLAAPALAVVGATCRAGLRCAAPPARPAALALRAPPGRTVMSGVEQSGKHEVNTNRVHSRPNPGARGKQREHIPQIC